MATRTIRTYPDPVLKRKAAPVAEFGEHLQQLIEDMLETMYAAPGVGLAAPQVGVSQRVIVIDISGKEDPAQLLVLVNPELVEAVGEEEADEGCLSVPDFNAKIKRAKKVAVRGHDRHGSPVLVHAEELMARALQHEIDHLEGTLLLDRLPPLRREIIKKKLKKAFAALRSED